MISPNKVWTPKCIPDLILDLNPDLIEVSQLDLFQDRIPELILDLTPNLNLDGFHGRLSGSLLGVGYDLGSDP